MFSSRSYKKVIFQVAIRLRQVNFCLKETNLSAQTLITPSIHVTHEKTMKLMWAG